MQRFTEDEMEAMRYGDIAPLQRQLGCADIVPTPDPETQRDAWLESRKAGLGGSDMAGILGLSPWSSAHEIWEEKTDRKASDGDMLRFRLGRALEPFTIAEFERETGLEVLPFDGVTFVRRDRPWGRGNTDGLVFDDGHFVGLYEGKTASIFNRGEWEHHVPVYYQTQAQHYGWVLDAERAFFGVLYLGRTDFDHHVLPRDEDDVLEMVEAGDEFWQYVEDDEPPPPDGSRAARDFRARMYRNYEKQNVELELDQFSDVLAFQDAHQRIKAAESDKEHAQQRIMEHVGRKYRGTFHGTKATVIRRNLELDVDSARRADESLVEHYTRTRREVDSAALIKALREADPELLLEVADFDERKLVNKARTEVPEIVDEHEHDVEFVDEDAMQDGDWDFFAEHSNADEVSAYVRLYGDDPEEAMDAYIEANTSTDTDN
ncbi:MAG: YqaJ viral recombinase family protein [Trueperaceae bacterium]|nr:YqaJ viral recombinase family protein [Trueperaceae bacterium]